MAHNNYWGFTYMTTARPTRLSLAIACLLLSTPVLAQNITTSGMTGRVVDGAGHPVAGATVTIVHEPSGTRKDVTTDADGRYTAQGLRVGGPFEITASKAGATTAAAHDVYLQLGQASSINLVMGAEQAKNATTLAGVTVKASSMAQIFSSENKGLATNLSQAELQAKPLGNRSIDDIVRLDPRIQVMDQGVGSFSAAGMNNRYNLLSVDGVPQGDPFGLNANGLPYLKSPISPEAIAEYNIATANYDVASDTVGADVNAVTKSGTNQFHGAVYYSYRNANHLVGDAGWLPSSNPGYHYHGYSNDWTGGLNVGGPIVKDKLFFFVSAEHERTNGIGADSANGLDSSLGNGASTSNKVSPGDLQKVIDIANRLGLKPGVFGGTSGLTYDDKRYLGKIDWNISNNHRASFVYQRTRESQPAVGGNGPSSVGLSSYTYTKAISTDNYALHLFDDWTDSFSTETKVAWQDFTQATTAPVQQPAVAVNLSSNGRGPVVNLGEEQFRHYNYINTKTLLLYWAGTYVLGDHSFKAGFDYRREKIYNLFGRTQFGQYTFWGLNNFAAGNYAQYTLFHPAPGYALNDIAGRWTYGQFSPFVQDTWQVNDQLSVQYGLRADIPHATGTPAYNAGFSQTFGYANNSTISSRSTLIEPRLSFNYLFNSELRTQLRGGIGLFQTTPPVVWLTNPYQNNGVTLLQYQSFNPAAAPFSPDPHGQNIPAGGGAGSIDVVDPNFKMPSAWKFSLALDRELPWWGLMASAEYEHIQMKNGILYQVLNIGAPTGTLPDGRLEYWRTPGEAGKPADALANQNRAFSPASTLLTNTNKGSSDSITLALSKPFNADLSGTLSFSYNRAKDVDPGTDTIAINGYSRIARVNPNSTDSAPSNYQTGKSVKLALDWQHAFFGGYKSKVSLFYSGRDGNRYTWTFGNDANGTNAPGLAIAGFEPVYIPTVNDPKVTFAPGTSAQAIQQFENVLGSDDYLRHHRGEIAGRNATRTAWFNQLDMSFAQEIPGIFPGNKGEIRLDIYNVLNLLNSDWGQQRNTGIYPTRTLVNYAGVNAKGQYVYSLPTDKFGNYQPQQLQTYDGGFYDPSRVVSRWSAMLTVRYTF